MLKLTIKIRIPDDSHVLVGRTYIFDDGIELFSTAFWDGILEVEIRIPENSIKPVNIFYRIVLETIEREFIVRPHKILRGIFFES